MGLTAILVTDVIGLQYFSTAIATLRAHAYMFQVLNAND